MENSKNIPSQKEQIPMAHKLETPMELVFLLRESAENITKSKNNEERVSGIAEHLHFVGRLVRGFDIGLTEIKNIRESKATSKGKFNKGAVRVVPHFGEKLVRDKLSDTFIKEEHRDYYLELLNKKIIEETKELVETMDRMKRIEETADVLEVLDALMFAYKINKEDVLSKRDKLDDQYIIKRSRRRRPLVSKPRNNKSNV